MELMIMQDAEIRKGFGARLKAARKQRKWTQKELANQLGIRFSQLNKYECGMHVPPVEKLIELAELLNTSVDYLLTGEQNESTPLHNTRLLERFRALADCTSDDQETVIKLIDAVIVKQKVQGALAPIENQRLKRHNGATA